MSSDLYVVSENSLRGSLRIDAPPGSDKRAGHLTAKPLLPVYAFAILTALLLPFIYDIVLGASVPDHDYGFQHLLHIGMTVVASLGGLLAILNTNGDFQHRLKAGLFSVLANFSVLILLITSLRLYYSRPVLIAAFFASIAVVSAANVLVERYRVRRIGIVPNRLILI